MLLSKALDLTDSVTASVTSHLPGPLAGPVHLAAATLTWVPRKLVAGVEAHGDSPAPEAPKPTAPAEREAPQAQAQAEPEVVLTLDRPAEQVEPPIDVVGEALRAERAEQARPAPPRADEDHVEVEEQVVYSTSSGDES